MRDPGLAAVLAGRRLACLDEANESLVAAGAALRSGGADELVVQVYRLSARVMREMAAVERERDRLRDPAGDRS